MKSHFKKEADYGYQGVINIFNKKEINIYDWVFKQLHKERGGIEFATPNVQGIIYLNYSDLYNCDITFVNSKEKYEATLVLPELEALIQKIEDMRLREVKRIRNMLKEMFKGDDTEREDGAPF
tara:strand:- start:1784 stop:2152 length:369 start_codon:yes stop_codon:yes gene_type:complete